MKRILFVDDESAVLESLRVRLKRVQHRWCVIFANTGAQAIDEFQRFPFDVVISDVRMAGMHGTRLLRTIAERWPDAVRIALTGVSNEQQVLPLVPIAHQFLSKPCEFPVLENTIERCLALQDLLREPQLRALVGRVRKVTPLRETYVRLQELLASEISDVREVAAAISADPMIAAKVLQTVNSAFFRSGSRVSSVEQAVIRLGLSTVRNLVLSVQIFAQWPDKPAIATVDLECLRRHTEGVVGIVAALTRNSSIADDAVLAALLHDVGYWVLANECSRELEQARALALDRGIPVHEAEREIFGASHAEIGAYLLGIWGFPHSIVEAVAHHHEPARVRQSKFDVLAALAVAHSLASPSDASAFQGPPPSDAAVTAEYLVPLSAPFTWDEAVRRAAEVTERSP